MQLLAPNTRVQQRYLVGRLIGRGGMGAVYEARDQRLNTTVALKQTLLGGRLDQAFEREAQILAGLRHAALPKVIDHFIDPAGQFLVMEFIPGADLGDLLGQYPAGLPPRRVLAWADQLLAALAYLHSRQPPVIHRDIKPQNIKLAEDDSIVLLDFGLAKGLLAQMPGATTASVYGYTQQYAPLEQIQGQGTDGRSDLFSAAATIYHLLTGSPPADALTRAAAVIGRQPDPLVPPARLHPHITPGLNAALMESLALHRDDRPSSSTQLRARLQALPATATPQPPVTPTPTLAASGATVLGGLASAADLSGSTWKIGYQEPGTAGFETFVVYFAPGGELRQMLSNGPGRSFGRWEQQQQRVRFTINHFSTWEGLIGTGGISGTARTPVANWDWKAFRVT